MTKTEFEQIPLSLRFVPAAAMLIIALIIYATHSNLPLFYSINQLYSLTGDNFWAALTLLGDAIVAIPLTLLFFRHKPNVLVAIFYALIIGTILSHLMKSGFDVTRPAGILNSTDIHIIGPVLTKNSFPSGHTMTIFAWVSIIIFHLPKNARALWVSILLVLASLVALSRSVVGAHWPIDLAAGATVGWLCGLLCTWLSVTLKWHNRKTANNFIKGFFFVLALVSLSLDSDFPSLNLWHKGLVLVALMYALVPSIDKLLPRLANFKATNSLDNKADENREQNN